MKQEDRFAEVMDAIPLEVHQKTDYRYCSEAIITDADLSLTDFKQELKNRGDSIILAGSPDKIHLHIHSNDPAELFDFVKDHGKIVSIKVDDMIKQYEISHNRKYSIGLVTDTACDLPDEFIREHQIQQIPFSINFGENLLRSNPV